MVNAKLIITVAAVCIAAAGAIFMFMRENNLTTKDLTLLEACNQAYADGDATQCEDYEATADRGEITWDTELPCMEGSAATWTHQGLFDAWELQENDPTYKAHEYLDETCADAGRRVDKRFMKESYTVGRNYGPCSMKGTFLIGVGNDDAECSGKSPAGSCNSGKCCLAGFNWPRGGKNYLVDGCYNHDYCLQKGSNGNGNCGDNCASCNGNVDFTWSNSNRDCDDQLKDAADKCVDAGWGWWGRGGCEDSVWAAIYTRTAMSTGPNDGYCGV